MNTSPASFKLALAQLNPIVGDISGNLEMARSAHARAWQEGADCLVLSELFIAGYPPEDLVLKPAFVAACEAAVDDLAHLTKADNAPAILIGTPLRDKSATSATRRGQDKVHNAVCYLDDGQLQAASFKVELPNYGVFDEWRTFKPGALPGPFNVRGIRIGVPICEDIWFEDVCECLAETGAELLIAPNGSPYDRNKVNLRMQMAVSRIVETGLPLVYVHQVGGQDELVFDGGSFVLQADRTLAFQAPQFVEDMTVVSFTQTSKGWRCLEAPKAILPDRLEADWRACVLGLRDYVLKNGFQDVVLGLSGGIDSAVVATMAVDALGCDKVRAIMLPYRYTSTQSKTDAALCAERLGLTYDVVGIGAGVDAVLGTLDPLFAGYENDLTEENVQSRLRGLTLMAISNKFGSLLLTTGNKSEIAVGYATLYGDMNGAFNPLKDLYKTQVYQLAAWRNSCQPAHLLGPAGVVIPERILTKAPSAELREDQTDQQSLPPYDDLDAILHGLVELDLSAAEVAATGYPLSLVQRIERLLHLAEYKRYQAAPGPKITAKAFGRDRRYPLTNRFRSAST